MAVDLLGRSLLRLYAEPVFRACAGMDALTQFEFARFDVQLAGGRFGCSGVNIRVPVKATLAVVRELNHSHHPELRQ